MTAHRTPPKPPHFDSAPVGTCRWCNQAIGNTKTGKPSKARWHTQCVSEYRLMYWPSEARKVVWRRDKGICRGCGVQCERRNNGWHLDHIQPLIESKGDLSFWQTSNMQTLCKPCHKAKTAREATERAAKRREEKNQ